MSRAQSAPQSCSHGSWLEPSSRENSAVSLVALSVCLLSHVCVNLTLFYCYTEHSYYSFLIRKCALFIRAQVVLCMLKCVLHGVFVLFKTLCMYVYICIYTHSVPSQMMAVVQHWCFICWHAVPLMQCSLLPLYLQCWETEGFSVKRDLMIFKDDMMRNRTESFFSSVFEMLPDNGNSLQSLFYITPSTCIRVAFPVVCNCLCF